MTRFKILGIQTENVELYNMDGDLPHSRVDNKWIRLQTLNILLEKLIALLSIFQRIGYMWLTCQKSLHRFAFSDYIS